MPTGHFGRLAGALLLALAATPCANAADCGPLLASIKAIRGEGEGNVEAGKAWRELVALGPDVLPVVLAAFDDADERAANWLRAAVDAVAEREVAAGRKLPADRLEGFIARTKHSPAARRLAYEWLVRTDPTTPARLLPGMLNDPSVELRRDAVALVLKEAKEKRDRGDKDGSHSAYRKALGGARDQDQVEAVVKALQEYGETVDVATHFGFIRSWQLIGPFDSTGGKGYAAIFDPERKIDLAAALAGKGGKEVRWAPYTTDDAYGNVDLNKAIGKHMGAAGYAYAVVESPVERPVEVRTGTKNAVKVFVNGQVVYTKEEYHHGKFLDQHVARVKLHRGRNTILLKVCQNEQKDTWAQEWDFQVRVCDSVGGAVPLTVVAEARKTSDDGRKGGGR
jgi:hypothetical protein